MSLRWKWTSRLSWGFTRCSTELIILVSGEDATLALQVVHPCDS